MISNLKISKENKQLISATSVIAGTCIGAGFLGIPYVASMAGFFTTMIYLIFFSGLILLINLCIGEVVLRTKGKRQLTGYAEKYLGKKGKIMMFFATKLTIYSAITAYIIGVGESMSFLFSGNKEYYLFFGVLFAILMSIFLWKGTNSLKKFETLGVLTALTLLFLISIVFFKKINPENLYHVNLKNIFVPFGVVLFSMMSFFSIPQAKIILGKNKKLLKKAIVLGTIFPAFFYFIFTMVVVGFMGNETPQIATFALGKGFIFLGILTIFTSYLPLGNVLRHNYIFDFKYSKKRAWFKSAIIPIFLFIITQLFRDFFSFIRVLSIGGVISGGMVAILILIINKRSEKLGNRFPEFEIPLNKILILFLSLIFLFGIFLEFFKFW